MKSLNTYLTEGIYNNLGIDDEIAYSELREWCQSYARAIGLDDINKIFVNGHTSGRPVINTKIYLSQGLFLDRFLIDTDPKYDLAPKGELPDYCRALTFNSETNLGILVKSNSKNPLRNFNNIPWSIGTSKNNISTKEIILTGVYDVIDFDNIKCEVILKIRDCKKIKQIKNIHNFKGLYLKVDSFDTAVDILNSFTGCKLKKDAIVLLDASKYDDDLTISGKQLEAYTAAAAKLGFISSNPLREVTDTLKKEKQNTYLKNEYNTLWLNQFSVTDYSFLKTLDPVYDVVAIEDNSREISESELRNLPANIMISITTRNMRTLYNKYRAYDFIDVYIMTSSSILIKKK